jgi:diguanylate cyclase (GGDEF)-like protein
VALVYVLALIGLDLAVTVAALVASPRVSLSHLGLYVALLGCGVVTVEAIRAVGEPKGTDTHDLLGVWFLPIAILFPPGYAFVGPLLVAAYFVVRLRMAFLYRKVFSFAAMSLGWGAASIAFHAIPESIAGPAPQSGAHAVTWLAAVAGCAVLGWAINAGSVLLAIRLATPEVRARVVFGGRTGAISDLIELSAAVTVVLVVAVVPVALILALPLVAFGQRYLMNAHLVNQTRVDPQSGALASAIWRSEADVETFRAWRTHRPLAVVLADVDDFASIGRTGVPGAEIQVLRAVATTLTDKLPAAAQVGRLRGAEFAIVLPGIAEDEARRLGVRIRDQLAAEPVEVERDGHLDFVVRPTVSVGVAALTSSRQTLTELIAAADGAVADARAAGGNRVSVAT